VFSIVFILEINNSRNRVPHYQHSTHPLPHSVLARSKRVDFTHIYEHTHTRKYDTYVIRMYLPGTVISHDVWMVIMMMMMKKKRDAP